MSDIDPVQFGELVGGVRSLNESVKQLTGKVSEIEERMNKGRGFLAGLSLGMAALGGGAGALAHKMFESLK